MAVNIPLDPRIQTITRSGPPFPRHREIQLPQRSLAERGYLAHSCDGVINIPTCVSIILSLCISSAHICCLICKQVYIGTFVQCCYVICVELCHSRIWLIKRIICYAINHPPEAILLFCNMSCDLFSVSHHQGIGIQSQACQT